MKPKYYKCTVCKRRSKEHTICFKKVVGDVSYITANNPYDGVDRWSVGDDVGCNDTQWQNTTEAFVLLDML